MATRRPLIDELYGREAPQGRYLAFGTNRAGALTSPVYTNAPSAKAISAMNRLMPDPRQALGVNLAQVPMGSGMPSMPPQQGRGTVNMDWLQTARTGTGGTPGTRSRLDQFRYERGNMSPIDRRQYESTVIGPAQERQRLIAAAQAADKAQKDRMALAGEPARVAGEYRATEGALGRKAKADEARLARLHAVALDERRAALSRELASHKARYDMAVEKIKGGNAIADDYLTVSDNMMKRAEEMRLAVMSNRILDSDGKVVGVRFSREELAQITSKADELETQAQELRAKAEGTTAEAEQAQGDLNQNGIADKDDGAIEYIAMGMASTDPAEQDRIVKMKRVLETKYSPEAVQNAIKAYQKQSQQQQANR